MKTVKTTRRSFFGWLGAILAMPFAGKSKRRTNPQWQHVAVRGKEGMALWFDGRRDCIVAIDVSGKSHHGYYVNRSNPLAKGMVFPVHTGM